jgi:type II secretory pathway pseudopilin PulG
MARPYEERNSPAKARKQQEDQRRMEFRRAIEDAATAANCCEASRTTELTGRHRAQLPAKRSTSALICTRSLRMNAWKAKATGDWRLAWPAPGTSCGTAAAPPPAAP